jgi:integrase
MQRGSMKQRSRKEGLDVWQFRWSETRLDGKRLYHKKIVGTVEQYPDENAARRAVVGLSRKSMPMPIQRIPSQ